MRFRSLFLFGLFSLLLAAPHTAGAVDSMASGTSLSAVGLTIAPEATDELFVGFEGARCDSAGAARPGEALAHGSSTTCLCYDQYGARIDCNFYLNRFWRSGDSNLPTAGRIPIFIPITQFYWNQTWQAAWEQANGNFFDANGFLTPSAANVLIAKNLLPSSATLTLRVYDVDSDNDCANGPPCYTKPEVDHIYVNGTLLETTPCGTTTPIVAKLTGKNGEWSIVSFQVPITLLKLPLAPGKGDLAYGAAAFPTPASNKIEIEIGVGDTDQCWGTGCNWATLDTQFLTQQTATTFSTSLAGSLKKAMGRSGRGSTVIPCGNVPCTKVPPIVFQHGWNNQGYSWSEHSGEGHFADLYVQPQNKGPSDRNGWATLAGLRDTVLSGSGLRSIWYEGIYRVSPAIDAVKNMYGTQRTAIIAHSKGGLDSRLTLQYRNSMTCALVSFPPPVFKCTVRNKNDVTALVQLDTPNMGSHWAGLSSGWNIWGSDAVDQLRPRYLNRHFNYYTGGKGPHWYSLNCYHVMYYASNYYDQGYWARRNNGEFPPEYYRLYGADDWIVSEEKALYPWQVRVFNHFPFDDGEGDCVEPQAQYYPNSAIFAWDGAAYIHAGHTDVYNYQDSYKYAIECLSPGFYGGLTNISGIWNAYRGQYARAGRLLAARATTPPDINYRLFHGYDPDTTQTVFKGMYSHTDNLPHTDPFVLGHAADTLGVTFFTEGEPDPNLITSLTDPNGQVINAINVSSYAAGATYTKVFPQDTSPGQNIVLYTIPNPPDGTWNAIAQSSSGRNVVTSANVSSHYLFLAQTTKDTYSTQEPIDVMAKFQHERGPNEALLGAIVTATIHRKDGSEAQITLFDDGAHGDDSANDGIYGGQFLAPQTVEGRADIRFEGQWQQDVVRIAYLDVAIVGDYADIDPCYSYTSSTLPYGDDSDGDGLVNTLIFPVPVSVHKAGHYELSASLFTGDSLIDREAYTTMFNETGPWAAGSEHIVNLSFDGRLISSRGLNGPYRLGSLRLAYFGEAADSLSDSFTLAQYDCICGTTASAGLTMASQFQRPRISIPGPNSDVAVDSDSPADSKWNRLDVTLGVDVTRGGDYNVDAELYDDCGDLILGTNRAVTMVSGLNQVTLQFDGNKIAAHGTNGPYKLKRVWVNRIATVPADSVSGMFSDVHTTTGGPYTAQGFQGSSVSGSVVTYGTGHPVSNASISYYFYSPYYIDCIMRVSVVTTSNSSGAFNTRGLQPGTYRFWATTSSQVTASPADSMSRSGQLQQLQAVSDTITVSVPPDTTITIRASSLSGVETGVSPPREIILGPIAPNPAESDVGIHFGLPTSASISITIFDVQGRVVRQLRHAVEPAGYHQTVWDGRSARGDHVASGIYFIRFKAGNRTLNRRIVVLR